VSRWEEDIFSQGAYSYYCEDFEAVYKNISNIIFFAGEHTDPIYYGSMHAAYNSGLRVLREMQTQ
jgi:polyamine oxidase